MINKISLIHPSRNRPQMAFDTAKNWISKSSATIPIEYILSLDKDIDDLEMYKAAFFPLRNMITIVINDNRSAIDAINNAAKVSTGDLLIVVSDDFDCPPLWDVTLTGALQDKEDYVVKTTDGQQDWIITLPIMDRTYYERFGYIYYPEYKHMFCDTEMTHVADLLNKKITVDISFKHNHYTTGKMQRDAINAKNDSTWAQGEALYLSRISTNFGIADCPGKLSCGPSHYHWLRTKGINII